MHTAKAVLQSSCESWVCQWLCPCCPSSRTGSNCARFFRVVMPVTNCYSANGEIIGEHTFGLSRLDYVTDGLGSVVATVYQTLTVKSTARYKPSGADLATSGTQPAFGFTGSTGSRRTGLPYSDLYNQARHLGTSVGRWTTSDPIWPVEPAYTYVRANPTTLVDPSGMDPCQGRPCNNKEIRIAISECEQRHLTFFRCHPAIEASSELMIGVTVGFDCYCPHPPTSTLQALKNGLQTVRSSNHGWRCNETGVGDNVTDSTDWPGCSHQTYVVTCVQGSKTKRFTVSNICCPYTSSKGDDDTSCFPVVKSK